MMASRVMDKQTSQDLQNQNQNQQALKCPRCDSSNTKFCYYNNYSLSQPRHFCKACKRYWTRGGTLRNVPVGGGCRKNKRVIVKRSSSSSTSISSPNPPSNPSIIMSSTSSNHVNPLFYGLPTNPNSELNLHNYPNFNSSRVSNVDRVNGYDLQSQLNALGLGFDPNKQIQAQGGGVTSSNPLLSSYSMFGSSNYPTMASLLASSVHQQKFLKGIIGNKEATTSFQGLVPYEELQQMPRNIGELKMENQMEQVSQTDPSLFWNNGTSFGGANWLDPSINGSSSPSLI